MINQLIKKTTSDGRELLVQSLKRDSIPIIIYGAEIVANYIFNYLQSQKIEINGFCVDDQYLTSNVSLYNMPIYPSSTIDSNFKEYNLIIGFDIKRTAFLSLRKTFFKHCNQFYFLPHIDHREPFEFSFVEAHIEAFQQTYDLLNDSISKQTLVAFINSKLRNSSGYNLLDLNYEQQYLIDLVKNAATPPHAIVDCGAFTGDTLLDFIAFTNNHITRYYAFEPDSTNRLKLEETILQQQASYVEIIPKGAWSQTTTLCFNNSGNSSSCIDENGNTSIEVTSIDNVIGENFVSFIKMDIEGSELEALKGARHTILRHMPILAICVYHKPNDLITIPQYISSLETQDKKYTFYLRHHSYLLTETVLYAIPVTKDTPSSLK